MILHVQQRDQSDRSKSNFKNSQVLFFVNKLHKPARKLGLGDMAKKYHRVTIFYIDRSQSWSRYRVCWCRFTFKSTLIVTATLNKYSSTLKQTLLVKLHHMNPPTVQTYLETMQVLDKNH